MINRYKSISQICRPTYIIGPTLFITFSEIQDNYLPISGAMMTSSVSSRISSYVNKEPEKYQQVLRDDQCGTFSNTKRAERFLEDAFQSWTSGLYTDVTVVVGTQRFPTHRLVLASLSDYFPPLLKHDEKESGEVTLKNIEPDDFSILLNYAYTGKVDITKDNVQSVLIASDYFNVDHVKEMCIKYMTANVDINNVCDVLVFAIEYALSEMMNNAKQFLKEHLDDVSKTDNFSHLDQQFLEQFFADNHLALYSGNVGLKSEEREKLIFNSVLRYLSKRSVSDPNIVEMMIRTVRLSQIPKSVVKKCLMNFRTLKNNDIIKKYVRLREVAVKELKERHRIPQATSRNSEVLEIPDLWFHTRKLASFTFHQRSRRYSCAHSPNPPAHLHSDSNIEIKRIDMWWRRWEDRVVIGGLSLTYRKSSNDDNKNLVYRRGSCTDEQHQNTIELEQDEFITKITVSSGYVIDRLHFETNRGRTFGPFVGHGGDEYTETAPPGPLSYLFDMNCDGILTHGSEALCNLVLRWITFS